MTDFLLLTSNNWGLCLLLIPTDSQYLYECPSLSLHEALLTCGVSGLWNSLPQRHSSAWQALVVGIQWWSEFPCAFLNDTLPLPSLFSCPPFSLPWLIESFCIVSIFVHHLRSLVGRSIVWINIIFSGIGSNPAHSIPWRVPHLIFADLQPSPILDIYLALFWDLIVCFNIQRPWWVIC